MAAAAMTIRRAVAVLMAVQAVLLLRHSARSRGIQEPRAQSVLQAFLDAATARSMTGCARSMTGECAPCDKRVRAV